MPTDQNRTVARASQHRRATDVPTGYVPPRVPGIDPAVYNERCRRLEQDWLWNAASAAGQQRIIAGDVAQRRAVLA